jgi:hypothetical protein
MQLSLPADAQKAVRRQWRRRVKASEYLVADGDSVEILGYKTRMVDISVERMERETPFRATLRSGKELPLLILIP